MVRPSNPHIGADKIETDKKVDTIIRYTLEEICDAGATKKDLRVSAKVISLADALGFYSSVDPKYRQVVAGQNKWSTDFFADQVL